MSAELFEQPTCPAHGAHPHNGPGVVHGGAICLDCPICRPPAEPQQADASPVLDLVGQYGAKLLEAERVGHAGGDEEPYCREADDLRARIAALVPQQPAQALHHSGQPFWLHDFCQDVYVTNERESHEQYCGSGPWRPLLVSGDPAPEQPESRAAYWERRFNEEAARRRSAPELADALDPEAGL